MSRFAPCLKRAPHLRNLESVYLRQVRVVPDLGLEARVARHCHLKQQHHQAPAPAPHHCRGCHVMVAIPCSPHHSPRLTEEGTRATWPSAATARQERHCAATLHPPHSGGLFRKGNPTFLIILRHQGRTHNFSQGISMDHL